jgi:hypothetical protein
VTLVERLEALTEPSREVDAAIFRLLLGTKRPQQFWNFQGCQPRGADKDKLWLEWTARRAPAYTSSLDAALLLVPDGWRLADLADTIEFDKGCRAVVRKRGDTSVATGSQVEHRGAKTLPIALTIAALKARGVK